MSQEKRFIKEKTRMGNIVTLDTNEKRCLEVGGFKPGQRIIDPNGDKATIKGVAKVSYSLLNFEVLWYLIDGDAGICFHTRDLNIGDGLLENGAKAIEED